jgi:hypothetical protein
MELNILSRVLIWNELVFSKGFGVLEIKVLFATVLVV